MTDIIEILEYTQSKTEKEFDIILEAMNFDIFDICGYYTESAVDNVKKFFKKIGDAIKKIIEKVKTSITELFNRKTVEKKIEQIDEAIKEDPSIGEKKVECVDYEKLNKLNEEAHSDIDKAKSIDELCEKMDKYRKQRNMILGGSVKVLVSISALYLFLTRGKTKQIKKLQEQAQTTSERITELAIENEELLLANQSLRDSSTSTSETNQEKPRERVKITIGGKNVKDINALNKQKATLFVEVLRNGANNLITACKDTVKAINDEDANPLTTGKNVLNGARSAIKSIGNVFNGEGAQETLKRKAASLTNEIDKWKNILEANRKKRDKYEKGTKEYKKYDGHVNTALNIIDDLERKQSAAKLVRSQRLQKKKKESNDEN